MCSLVLLSNSDATNFNMHKTHNHTNSLHWDFSNFTWITSSDIIYIQEQLVYIEQHVFCVFFFTIIIHLNILQFRIFINNRKTYIFIPSRQHFVCFFKAKLTKLQYLSDIFITHTINHNTEICEWNPISYNYTSIYTEL